jgi:hypothetical protein
MVETFGMAGMLVLAFIVLAAVYILMRLLDRPSDDEEGEAGKSATRGEKPAELSDEEFIGSYTGPMLEDALEKLEMAVESVRSGLHFYGGSVWEEAGGEFHLAVNSIDNAAGRLKEVVGMVEDQGSEPVRLAKARLEECRRMRALTIRMEEACDAMVEGKEEEARKLEAVKPELEKIADEWRK